MGLGDGLGAIIGPLLETRVGRWVLVIVVAAIVAAQMLWWVVEQVQAYAGYVAIGVGALLLIVVLVMRGRGEESRSYSPTTMIAFGAFFFVAATSAIFAMRKRGQTSPDLPPPDPREIDHLLASDPGAADPRTQRPSAARLTELAGAGLRTMLRAIPKVASRAFKGGLAGFFLVGLAGLVVWGGGLAASSMSKAPAASWFLIATFFWVPFVFAVGGSYAGAVRGLIVGLAEQMMELGIVPFLYATVRPALASAAATLAATGRRAPGGQTLSAARKAIDERILQTDEALNAQMGPPQGLGDRIQRALSRRARKLLCHAAVRAALQRGSQQQDAVVELEQLGIERLTEALGGSLMGAMKLHIVLAYAGALVLGAVPYALYIAMR